MAVYRVFTLGSGDHIVGVEILNCQTDDEAMCRAPSFGGAYKAVEVWELDRRVGRVDLANEPEASGLQSV